MRRVIVFKGEITAEQPISYSVPGAAKGTDHTLPRIGRHLYLTASGLRGALRHAATEIVMDLVDANPDGKKLNLDDYFLLAMGGVKDAKVSAKKGTAEKSAEDEDGDDAEKSVSDTDIVRMLRANRHVRAHNPLVGLFGSMRHGVSGSLYCAHAIAPEGIEPTRVRYVRSNDFQRDPGVLDRLDESVLDAFIARQADAAERTDGNNRKKALEQEKKKLRREGASERLKEIHAEIAAIEAAQPKDVQLQLPNITYQVIPAGTVFSHEFTLSNPTDAEVALLLRALDRFALNPLLGGHRAHGLGRVSGRWSVRMREQGEREFTEAGEVWFKGDFTGLELTGRIAEFTKVWDALVAARDALEFTEAGIAAA